VTQAGAGVKRQTSTVLSDFSDLLVHFSDGQHETCNGDSGGPAFMTIDGQEVIVGLTSFGDATCTQGGFDTRLDAVVSFIDPFIQANDPNAANSQNGSGTPIPPTGPQPAQSNGGTATRPANGHATGDACVHDADCASNVCGIGDHGTLVCVNGNPTPSFGGCSTAPGSQKSGLALALLLAIAVLLRRGLG
jgi:MYXO-CTERM domain-containing protein